ncbi:cell division protein FtsL [Agrilactobacillus yilanensis]|uniref:Cell division protein FtsL n=1 Tax=Agrilactobacillus yilanensis TaxID=2485997 RepID=A0ABW4J656_9LACO|nr:cell division protein FtsL [Agrilactobacillus yilanensis]
MDNTAKQNYNEAQVLQPEQPQQQPQIENNPKAAGAKVPLSLFERLAMVVGGLIVIGLMISLVSAKIAVGTAQRNLQSVNTAVSDLKTKNADLKQEIGTLNSSDRLQAFAKKHGLTFNEESVRNISK